MGKAGATGTGEGAILAGKKSNLIQAIIRGPTMRPVSVKWVTAGRAADTTILTLKVGRPAGAIAASGGIRASPTLDRGVHPVPTGAAGATVKGQVTAASGAMISAATTSARHSSPTEAPSQANSEPEAGSRPTTENGVQWVRRRAGAMRTTANGVAIGTSVAGWTARAMPSQSGSAATTMTIIARHAGIEAMGLRATPAPISGSWKMPATR